MAATGWASAGAVRTHGKRRGQGMTTAGDLIASGQCLPQHMGGDSNCSVGQVPFAIPSAGSWTRYFHAEGKSAVGHYVYQIEPAMRHRPTAGPTP